MECSDFRDGFSDYFDGTAEPSFVGEADAHLAACESCRRYQDVMARGAELLKGMPPVAVSEDFFPRLQHRIYHIEDGAALIHSEATGSWTTVAPALAIALVLAVAAWSPALIRAPRVALPPVVVSHPEPRLVGVRPPQLWSGGEFAPSSLVTTIEMTPTGWVSTVELTSTSFVATVDHGLWDDPRVFVRYSPLTASAARQTRSIEAPILVSAAGSPR